MRAKKERSVNALSCGKANAVVALTTCAQNKFINPQSGYELFSWSLPVLPSPNWVSRLRLYITRDQTQHWSDVESLLYRTGESIAKSTVVG